MMDEPAAGLSVVREYSDEGGNHYFDASQTPDPTIDLFVERASRQILEHSEW